MDLSENQSPDSTTCLENIKLEHGDFEIVSTTSENKADPEIIEISSDDEADSQEVFIIYSGKKADNPHEINEIYSEDKADVIIKFPVKKEPDIIENHSDDNSESKIVYTCSENERTSREVTNNLISEYSEKLLTTVRKCFVHLHNSVDESEISKCDKCIKPVATKSDSLRNGQRLQCGLCRNFYSSKLYLKYHACPADKEDDQDRNCKELLMQRPESSKFDRKSLQNFMKKLKIPNQNKLDNKSRFVCSHCGKTYKYSGHLRQHLKIHSDVRSYVCRECGKSYKHSAGLHLHLKTHGNKKHYDCKVCRKSFEKNETVGQHLKLRTRNFLVCSKACKGMLVDEKLDGFTCHQCGETFDRKRNLKRHLDVHSEKKSDGFLCSQCGKTFEIKQHFEQHSLIHGDVKSFVCKKCGRAFKQYAGLYKHMQFHTDIKPYGCSLCGKAFRRSAALIQHVKLHSNEKAYVCDVCGEGFKLRFYLNSHMIIHS